MPPAWQTAGRLLVWAALSVGLSLYNKWLLGLQAFNFPVSLSFAHMAGAALLLNAYISGRRPACGGRPRGWEETTTPGLLEAGRPPTLLAAGQQKGMVNSMPPPGRASLPPPPQTANFSVSPSTGYNTSNTGWVREQAWWARRHGRHLLPIAAMFGASVCLRNSAFAGLPLPIMQLVAACAPLVAYVASVSVGLASLTLPRLASIAACVAGVSIAISDRLVPFSGVALARHAAGISLEVCRSILLQLLIRKIVGEAGGVQADGSPVVVTTTTTTTIQGEQAVCPNRKVAASSPPSMHVSYSHRTEASLAPSCSDLPAVPLPTTLLAVYSPVCAAMLAIPAAALELRPALADAAGRPLWFWLACGGNIAVALAYNLASISCLQHAGVMAMSLTGFAKDWSLVVLSTLLFGREVTPRFVAGMAAVTAAVVVYSHCRGG